MTDYVSRLMHNVQEFNFELSRSMGLDIALMKSFLDYRIKFRIENREWCDTEFINLNSKDWMKFTVTELVSFLPVWDREKATCIFNCLVSSELIEIQGDIEKGDVLILVDIKT